jgi:transcription initiation factor TFIIIB Brf1 subunit/transcription initiation factor TFIIB
MSHQDNEKLLCPECSGTLVLHSGEFVCSNCGLVVSKQYLAPVFKINQDNISTSQYKHYVALGKRMHIVDGMGSYIDFQRTPFFYDGQGTPLSSDRQALYRKLKFRYSLRLRIDKKESDYRALKSLNHVASMLQISDSIRDRAAYIYQKAVKKIDKKISNHIVLIAACLFFAIREYKELAPVTIQEVTQSFKKLGHRINVKKVIRTALELRSLFIQEHPKIRKSEEYLHRIISDVVSSSIIERRLKERDLTTEDYRNLLTQKSYSILTKIDSINRGGRNPYIFAVSTIYCADRLLSKKIAKKPILTQKILAKITKVAEYSIRDHYTSVLKPIMILSR